MFFTLGSLFSLLDPYIASIGVQGLERVAHCNFSRINNLFSVIEILIFSILITHYGYGIKISALSGKVENYTL